METSRLLLLIFIIAPSACADTSEVQCEDFDEESYLLLEGEAFYFVPYFLHDKPYNVTWYKNKTEPISTDKNQSVHYNGHTLLFLNLHTEDSGFYTGRLEISSKKCINARLKIDVFTSKIEPSLLYGNIANSDINMKVPCPEPVKYICKTLEGKLSWKKDYKPLQGRSDEYLWVYNVSKDDEGIYTCTCNWTYNNNSYISSGSRRLKHLEPSVHRTPEILSPASDEVLANEGVGINLNCSVFCGTNVLRHCKARWEFHGGPFTDRYSQNIQMVIKNITKNTISTAVLHIEKVSAEDFQTEFTCIGEGLYESRNKTVTLKQKDSIIPLVIGCVCALLFCVLAAMLVKCFAIDLALIFRPYFSQRNRNQDLKAYDAYVAYQMQHLDKASEDTLSRFITKVLPSVLEDKCGYRLFIHGRDDIPGEDRLELVEECMQQSKRLIVILTPGSVSESADITDKPASPALPQNSAADFDCQVGLHHALVQQEMSVILIQIGETGPEGYKHLPPGLQHLILKSAPIKWKEGSWGAASWNSHFWKKVRYLMPARPATKCSQSAVI